MRNPKNERLELLAELKQLVAKNIITERQQLTSKIRRKNRQFKRMLKEIEQWKEELYAEQCDNDN